MVLSAFGSVCRIGWDQGEAVEVRRSVWDMKTLVARHFFAYVYDITSFGPEWVCERGALGWCTEKNRAFVLT